MVYRSTVRPSDRQTDEWRCEAPFRTPLDAPRDTLTIRTVDRPKSLRTWEGARGM